MATQKINNPYSKLKVYENDNFYLCYFNRHFMHVLLDLNKTHYPGWFYDQEVTKYNSHGLFQKNDKEIEDFLDSIENNERLVFAIIHKKNNMHIGNVCLQRFNWIDRSAEYTVLIGEKDYWGNGYCSQATGFLFEHGLNKLNLHRIYSGTSVLNLGMQNVFQKLGMTYEGTFRDAQFLHGQYHGIVLYSILKNEWNGINHPIRNKHDKM